MDKVEFAAFVREQQEPLRRFLLNLSGGDGALADDIAQDAFIKAYTGLSSFHGGSKLSTWLFRIAYNCFYDQMSKRMRLSEVQLPTDRKIEGADRASDPMVVQSAGSDRITVNNDINKALKNLAENEKAVLLLFYMEEKKISDIAVITGMKENTVKSHLSRGREHLKVYLKQAGYGE